MTIEFNCPNCSKLLRTRDDKAGARAKCPDCGSPVQVPAAGPPAEEDFGYEEQFDYGEEDYEDYGEDFAAAAPPPRAGKMKACPMCGEKIKADAVKCRYCGEELRGTARPSRGGRSRAKSRVTGPAISLLVVAGLSTLLQLVFGVGLNLMLAMGNAPGGMPAQQGQMLMFQGTLGVVFGVIEVIIGIVVLIGAWKMLNLTSHGMAMTASILIMIPVISPCCLLGLPFGIWSLVVLSDENVKAAFR